MKLKFSTMKNKIFENEFILKMLEAFFGRGSFVIFTLLFSFISTRLYGAEVFGKYTFAYTLVSIVMILAKAGLDHGLMYSIPKNKWAHVSFSFMMNMLISFLLIAIIWFLVDDIYIRFMLPLIWFISAEAIFFGIYRSLGKIKEFYFINGFLSMILRVASILALYYLLGKSEYSIAIGVYISFIFSNIIYLYKHRNKFGKIVFDKAFLTYSLTMVLSTVMATLINRSDIVMLGIMSNDTDVGVYQITVQISKVVSVLLMVFNTVFAPQISRLHHQGKREELKKLYIKATRLLALYSLIATFLLLTCSKIILYIFGTEFLQGQTALILRSVGQFLNISVGGVWLMLSMTGKPKFQMYANIFAFIINIVLNLVLIPVYGINGAAFASMISIILISIVGYYVVSKEFKVKVFKFF